MAARNAALLLAAWTAGLASGSAPATGIDAQRAQTHYRIYCQGCHLPDASGTPGFVPALAGSMGSYLGVEGGRRYIGRVPGATSSPLTDAELAEVYNWLLTDLAREGAPAAFAPFTAQEMASYRADPLLEIRPVRRALVERIREAALPIDDGY